MYFGFFTNVSRLLYEAPKNLFIKSDEYTNLNKPFKATGIDFGHHNTKGVRTVVAGGLAGGIEMMLTYPTEYVKTQLQLDEKGDRKKYNGSVDCIKRTVNRYGYKGLYHGMSILIYGAIPKVGVRFTVYENFKNLMFDEHHHLNPYHGILCGLGAGIVEAITVVTPMETLKVKMIHDKRLKEPRYKGFLHAVSTIYNNKGIGGFYKGPLATILKQGSNHGIRFFVMEKTADIYTGGQSDVKVPKYIIGVFGVLAGTVSVLCNTPIDILKTRMQGLEAYKYKNTWDCAKQIATQEGPRAFYKGAVMRLIGVCLNVPIVFVLYECFMELFNKL